MKQREKMQTMIHFRRPYKNSSSFQSKRFIENKSPLKNRKFSIPKKNRRAISVVPQRFNNINNIYSNFKQPYRIKNKMGF